MTISVNPSIFISLGGSRSRRCTVFLWRHCWLLWGHRIGSWRRILVEIKFDSFWSHIWSADILISRTSEGYRTTESTVSQQTFLYVMVRKCCANFWEAACSRDLPCLCTSCSVSRVNGYDGSQGTWKNLNIGRLTTYYTRENCLQCLKCLETPNVWSHMSKVSLFELKTVNTLKRERTCCDP